MTSGPPKGTAGPNPEGPVPVPSGCLPPAFNQGWTYRDRPGPGLASGTSVASYYASRYGHSDRAVWLGRIAAGEVVDGHPTSPKRQRDAWTFSRRMGVQDPNWQLVATGD